RSTRYSPAVNRPSSESLGPNPTNPFVLTSKTIIASPPGRASRPASCSIRFGSAGASPFRERHPPAPGLRGSDPALDPVPGLCLHRGVELVGRGVEPGAGFLGDPRLLITRRELGEAGADAVAVEQPIAAAVDDQQCRGHGEGG